MMRSDETEVVFQFADPIGTALLLEEENATLSRQRPLRVAEKRLARRGLEW